MTTLPIHPRTALAKSGMFCMAFIMVIGVSALLPARARAAACPPPTTDYGTVTSSITVPSTATYNVWSRLMAPDTTNNSYSLEIDGTNCYVVGGGSITPNTWTWVNYQNGVPTSPIQLSLSQGTHSLRFIGRQPNVSLDRVVVASDLTCTPTGTDGSCTAPVDKTPPTVSLSVPASASGTVTISATANDNVGVTKVEFYVNSALQSSDPSAPYSFSWNTAGLQNDLYSVTAKAYDAAGNIGTDTQTVSVQNSDTQAPTVPTNVSATANAYNKVTLNWTASTDNIGVTGYMITRNGSPLAQVGTVTSYQDTTVSANTQYSYTVTALDGAGNKSAASAGVTVTTPSVPDTQAPSVPAGLGATAVSSSQINLAWTASTDNIGVTGYDIYRATATGAPQKVTTVTTTSFGDTGLNASTQYSYYVQARDAAGNVSAASSTASATTQAVQTTGTIKGTIKGSNTGQPIPGSRAVIFIGGNKFIYSADSQGVYTIPGLAPGKHKVTYRGKGYFPQTISITVTSGATTTKNVTLQKR